MHTFTTYFLGVALSFSIFLAAPLSGQLSVAGLELPYGQHTVGYRHYVAHDSTRTYIRTQDWTNESVARPIPISVWYPALPDQPGARYLQVFDYLRVLRDEEEWEQLPEALIMSWFEFPNSPENQQRIKETTRTRKEVAVLPGKYPVVIYAASLLASSTENFALCELLASHGYLVLAVPGRGAESRPMYGTAEKNAEGQARDVEFLIQEARRHPAADADRLATLDYSFGGLATAISQMRNSRIKAMVSLDGRSRYDYATIFKSPAAHLDRFDVPFLHLAQKEIPAAVLAADNIDPALNTEFRLFDSLRYSEAYALRLHDLSHRHFSTMGLLLKNKDERQDKTDTVVMAGHRVMALYTLNFLDAYLKKDTAAKQFLAEAPAKAGIPDGRVAIKRKQPKERAYTLNDFNDRAAAASYRSMDSLYQQMQLEQPAFSLLQWQLNNLGLQLGFSPEKLPYGIRIFELAIRLYPQSGNLHDSLAEVLLHAGKLKAAAHHFRESLRLDPGNTNAQLRLEELKN